jgi:hypothetical protein|tara:strand:- start:44 stop:496 length:453 start_codon:yes stop_codon:yes gene_type:complete
METSSVTSLIEDDIKSSMKKGNKVKTSTLRMAKSEIKLLEINKKNTLSNTETLSVIQKMIKQRKESIAHFDKAGRKELVEKETNEISFLEVYLPEQLTELELQKIVTTQINSSSANSIKDMGKVMGILKGELEGKADMGVVSNLVKELLS